MANLLALAAPDAPSLRKHAASLLAALDQAPHTPVRELCARARSLSTGGFRAARVVADAAELRAALESFAAAPDAGEVTRPEVAFLFTGQGAQYAGMGQDLYDGVPRFRALVDQCAQAVGGEPSLTKVLYPDPGVTSPIDDTAYAQPALYALEVALAQLLVDCGVRPAVVLGHSVGEFAAACTAGVFDVAQGARLIAARGRLMQALPRDGAMVAVLAGADLVRPKIAAHTARVSIAAFNGPDNTVLSGARDVVAAVARELSASGLRVQELRVSHAFHSPLMAPMLEPFAEAAAAVTYDVPRIGFVSNLTGASLTEAPDAAYWRAHVAAPVRFAEGMRVLFDRGTRVFVEVGPQATLLAMGRRCTPVPDATWVPTLKKGQGARLRCLDALATLHCLGCDVDSTPLD